jgi:hypothetical protein
MKRVAAVAAGVVAGILLAGPVVAFSVWLPPSFRNEYIIVGIAALVVAVTVRAAWMWSGRRSE